MHHLRASLPVVLRALQPRCARLIRSPSERDAMRKRKPTIPRGAPKGTVWFGGPIEWFRMTLRIAGETLIPADVTKILQCQPSQAEEKGQPLPRKTGRPERIAKTGRWHFTLSPEDTDEWDCGEAILELLGRSAPTPAFRF